MDMGVYPLHVLTGLLGPVQRVTAMTGHVLQDFIVPDGPHEGKVVPVEEDDNWHMLLDFGGSRIAGVAAQGCIQDTRVPQVEIHGLKGTIALNILDVAAPVELFRTGIGWQQIKLPQTGRLSGPDHLLGIEHLIDSIQNSTKPVLDADHALHVIEIIEKAAQSALEGTTLKVTSTFS